MIFSAANAQNKIKLVQFSSGYISPIGIENCGDSRLFIIEQQGRILIADSAGNRMEKPYLDITDKILPGGERGLLGLAFDPAYASNGFFYVNYTDSIGNTQISRFKVRAANPDRADKNSEKPILSISQPFKNHNGGCIRFGPDGFLYIGMGDGGDAGDPNNNAQNPMSLLGKMLRINVHSGDKPYKIPRGNPFVDSANYLPEIWALGLRNPWRWSFDALNGAMLIADVGQGNWEEVNLQLNGVGGLNYGWRCYEGKHEYNTTGCNPRKTYKFPIFNYGHSDSTGDCSITGGFVYRGSLYPTFYGKYFCTDYCSGIFRVLYTEDGQQKVKRVLDGDNSAYTSFGEDVNHELYVCNKANGTIYHITPGTSLQANDFAEANNSQKEWLRFSPNPSKGNINISYYSPGIQKIIVRITSVAGQQVYYNTKNISTGANTWNIDLRVPKGMYYVNVINSEGDIISGSLKIE